jgi:L,D-transpeptidase catalytic domain/Putative peptidoglycan binding domain
MHRRVWVVTGVLLALAGIVVSGAGASAYFWDRSQADMIARGVTIGGVAVGGLQDSQARALLEARFAARLRRPVRLTRDGRTFTIRPTSTGLRLDVGRMVDEAIAASRAGGLYARVRRAILKKSLGVSIPLRASLSQSELYAVAVRVAGAIDTPAKSAGLLPKPLAVGIDVTPSRWGVAVDQAKLVTELTSALTSFDGPHELTIPVQPVRPRLGLFGLSRRYSTYILVSRETYTLRLFKHLKLVKTYRIAVGRIGLETPAGEYTINDKQINPSWHVPLSSWAGDLAGRVIPPGPDDPIKARWLGFFDGAGIHGTDEISSIGTAASHGCIRMTIPDVEDLYPRVPLHTPIYVG